MVASCERAVALGHPVDRLHRAPRVHRRRRGRRDRLHRAGPLVRGPAQRRWTSTPTWPRSRSAAGASRRCVCCPRLESGQPHLFGASEAAVLAGGRFDRVLGSCPRGRPRRGPRRDQRALPADAGARTSSAATSPRCWPSSSAAARSRCWPTSTSSGATCRAPAARTTTSPTSRSTARSSRALAASGRALEFNTKSWLTSVGQLRWWYEAGGEARHLRQRRPRALGRRHRFAEAAAMAEAAGFRRAGTPATGGGADALTLAARAP